MFYYSLFLIIIILGFIGFIPTRVKVALLLIY